jgi:LPS export ABC transporter protein LptC
MKNKKMLLTIAAGMALLGLVVFWLMQGSAPTAPPKPPGSTDEENLRVLNSSLKEEKDGRLVWELQIGEMEYHRKTDKGTMKNVSGKWYREDGSVLSISSDGGELLLSKKDVRLKGNVRANLSSGGEIAADELGWLQSEDSITASGSVRLTKDDVVATADKAVTDTGMEQLRLEGNAEVRKGAQP